MHMQAIKPQLDEIFQLLPEIGGNPNILMLLKACDNSGPKDCALIPLNHCLHTPGGPLKVISLNNITYIVLRPHIFSYSIP